MAGLAGHDLHLIADSFDFSCVFQAARLAQGLQIIRRMGPATRSLFLEYLRSSQ